MSTEQLMALEINCETGEEILRPLTADEIAQREKDIASANAEQLEAEKKTQLEAELKASALAKLAALGLSEEEAKAIAG